MKLTLPTATLALSLLGAADGARIETYVTTGAAPFVFIRLSTMAMTASITT